MRLLILFLISFLILTTQLFANTPELTDKELLAKFDNTPSPPKNINDVIKLLDNSKADVQSVEKYKQIVNSTPDPNLTKSSII